MIYITHRVNTVDQLKRVPPACGVEVDLRDSGKRLILQHDPFGNGEDFETFMKSFRHSFIILNVKSERIEPRVIQIMRNAGVQDYFFLDCSFPMIRHLIMQGESKIAVRFSEFEPLENAMALAGQVKWVWVDCFTKLPLSDDSYRQLKAHFKLCVVSPELQGRDISEIPAFMEALQTYPVDAVCTKRVDIWNASLLGKVPG